MTRPPVPLAKFLRRALGGVRRVGRGLELHNAFEAAASIAFWFFLSLVPLLVLVGFLIGQVARAHGIDQLVAPLLEVIPTSAEGLVHDELERLAGGGAAPIAPLGIIGFLWTASSGLHNLMDVFESAAMTKRQPWWKQRAIALGWVVLGVTTACALALLLVKTDAMMQGHDATSLPTMPASTSAPAPSFSAPLVSPPPLTQRVTREHPGSRIHGALRRRVRRAFSTPREPIVAASVLLIVGASLLAGFYRFAVEHPPGIRRRVWPGTITAVLSWLAVSWIFGEYAGSLADYALYYGSLAAVAVLLVWLYLTSLMLVVGAEVNAQLEGVRAAAS